MVKISDTEQFQKKKYASLKHINMHFGFSLFLELYFNNQVSIVECKFFDETNILLHRSPKTILPSSLR